MIAVIAGCNQAPRIPSASQDKEPVAVFGNPSQMAFPNRLAAPTVPMRHLLSLPLPAESIRASALRFSYLVSVLAHTPDPSLATASPDPTQLPVAVTPRIVRFWAANNSDFFAVYKAENGLATLSVPVESYPVWLADVNGDFQPQTRGMRGRPIHHLLLSFSQDGRLENLLELTDAGREKLPDDLRTVR